MRKCISNYVREVIKLRGGTAWGPPQARTD